MNARDLLPGDAELLADDGGGAARASWLATIGLSVAAAGWCAFLTRRGMAVSPDSGAYLAGAASLCRDFSYRGMDGMPITNWPPGYPMLLAALSCGGLPALEAARLVNVFAGAATIAIAHRWLWLATRSTPLVLAGSGSIALSVPFVLTARFVWSEQLFTAVALLGLWLLASGRTAFTSRLALVPLAAAPLVRIAGLPLTLLAPLGFFRSRAGGLRRRMAVGLLTWALALLPIALFMVRNVSLGLPALGLRGASGREPVDVLVRSARTLASWFLPWRVAEHPLGAGIFVAALVAGSIWWRRDRAEHERSAAAGIAALTVFLYVAFVVAASILGGADPPDHRIMAPVVVPAMVWVCGTVVADGRWLGSKGDSQLAAIGLSIGLTLLSAARAAEAIRTPPDLAYNSDEWRNSETAAWVAANRTSDLTFSTRPVVLFLHHGIRSFEGPRRHPFHMPQTPVGDLEVIDRALAHGERPRLVRFVRGLPGEAFTKPELEARYRLDLLFAGADGEVLAIVGHR